MKLKKNNNKEIIYSDVNGTYLSFARNYKKENTNINFISKIIRFFKKFKTICRL